MTRTEDMSKRRLLACIRALDFYAAHKQGLRVVEIAAMNNLSRGRTYAILAHGERLERFLSPEGLAKMRAAVRAAAKGL